MLSDLTILDSLGWDMVKKALNQRVVVGPIRYVSSKRNRVWIVETDVRPVVVKRFLSGKCGNEFETLLRARAEGIDVPFPIAQSGEYLVSEYVSGETCDVAINHMFDVAAVDGIGAWLARFHSRLSDGGRTWIMSDAVPSNFVLSGESVYGLDFEDSAVGNPLDDTGKMAASILASEPFFTPIKFDLCIRMLRSYERESHVSVEDQVRPFVSKHLRIDASNKPLFRRTMLEVAKSIENGWPNLA